MRQRTVSAEPTGAEIALEISETYPGTNMSTPERTFLDAVADARRHGVGFGWMRQAIGIAWKLKDPIGYMDDERIRELFGPKKRKGRK